MTRLSAYQGASYFRTTSSAIGKRRTCSKRRRMHQAGIGNRQGASGLDHLSATLPPTVGSARAGNFYHRQEECPVQPGGNLMCSFARTAGGIAAALLAGATLTAAPSAANAAKGGDN